MSCPVCDEELEQLVNDIIIETEEDEGDGNARLYECPNCKTPLKRIGVEKMKEKTIIKIFAFGWLTFPISACFFTTGYIVGLPLDITFFLTMGLLTFGLFLIFLSPYIPYDKSESEVVGD